jgi:glutamate dehydrogenase
MADGHDARERDELLASMTDEVGEQVLDDNKAQTLVLAIARTAGAPMVNVHARYLTCSRPRGGSTGRSSSCPPTSRSPSARRPAAASRTPEFAVLLAYTKTTNIEPRSPDNLPDDPYLDGELFGYFPRPLRERYADQIRRHRLRREIVATQLGNQMVNISGISVRPPGHRGHRASASST